MQAADVATIDTVVVHLVDYYYLNAKARPLITIRAHRIKVRNRKETKYREFIAYMPQQL